MIQSALITGATGFIGGHLVEALLERGVSVRCAVRAQSRTEHLRALDVELREVDLDDTAGLRRAAHGSDVVFHLAARTAAIRPRQLMRVNALATANVARACAAQTTPPVLLYVSSIAASGPIVQGRVRTEQDRPSPVSWYGRSKRGGELAVAEWAHLVPATIVRPAIVFGPRNRELFPVFESIWRTKTHVVPFFSPPPLSFIEVQDLVRLLLDAADRGRRLSPEAEADSQQGVYFACQHEYPNYRQLGRLVATALGAPRVVYLHLGHPLPWLVGGAAQVAAALSGREWHVNVDKMREASVESWACSSARAEAELGFQCAAPLYRQFADTADWYTRHGWLRT